MSQVAYIKVYFTGTNYLNKIIVSDNLSKNIEQTFTSPNNTLIIRDIVENFNFPSSIVVWGKDFSSQNSNKYRFVQLFNHSSCRLDYDAREKIMVFTNASLLNLGVTSTLSLPTSETHVSTIIITF
jgi:hypothetical protein